MPFDHVVILSVNYGVTKPQVQSLRELIAKHRDGGTAIVSVQENPPKFIADLGPSYQLYCGAFRNESAKLIALRSGVFELG